jgi:hypothetical protein
MDTDVECVCCCEVERVQAKKDLHPDVRCITELEGFGAVCLNVDVLETAYFAYRERYGIMAVGNDNNA